MRVSLPVYVVQQTKPEGRVFVVRPLFAPLVTATDAQLQRALQRIAGKLSHALNSLAEADSHRQLADACFDPELQSHVFKLRLDLRRRDMEVRLLFASFSDGDRQIVLVPGVNELCFDVRQEESIEARGQEACNSYFRRREKAGADVAAELRRVALQGAAWILHVDADLRVRRPPPKPKSPLALLFGEADASGPAELRRVGRCLDETVPDDQASAIQRDQEVADLFRLLTTADRRPLAIVGPHLVGKTAVLHEVVRRRVREKVSRSNHGNTWLLDPGRLVSGMSYVGQWEERLLAILKETKKRDHVLYFVDFLGMFQAGVTSCSALSMADVMRQWIRRSDVRVVAELTPASWNRFRQRDQALADQFHVLPVRPTSDEQTWRIMVHAARLLEGAFGCVFEPAAVPEVLGLTRRYEPQSAYPGKGVRWLNRLATRAGPDPITRQTVVDLYSASTGLNHNIIDQRQRCTRNLVQQELAASIIGQDVALDSLVNAVMLAKAQLSPPERPLATLLFLGPTGVGKTHCAKSLAKYLFGDERRMLRFDMNEFSSAEAVMHLAGSPRRPDGLMTSAIRRQPFQVLLLDEIEKAHPDVFDLLLQVLGEGRLTDANGRVADFTQAIVILTSNLGSAASGRALGFERSLADSQRVYTRAAEEFFRPEFFNRLDRIIPFQPLGPQETEQIARQLLQQVMQREGFLRRHCLATIDEAAMRQVAEAGFHPDLGARALKRAIERDVVAPLGARLAAVHQATPVVITVLAGAAGLMSVVEPLESCPLTRPMDSQKMEPGEATRAARRALPRFETWIVKHRSDEAIVAGSLTPEQAIYFELKEQLDRWRVQLVELEMKLEEAREQRHPPQFPHAQVRRRYQRYDQLHLAGELAAAQDVHAYLDDVLQAASPLDGAEQAVWCLRSATALFDSIVRQGPGGGAVMLLRSLSQPGEAFVQRALPRYSLEQFDVKTVALGAMHGFQVAHYSGVAAWPLLQRENGVWLVYGEDDELAAIQTIVLPLASADDPGDVAGECIETWRQWRRGLSRDPSLAQHNPLKPGPLLRRSAFRLAALTPAQASSCRGS